MGCLECFRSQKSISCHSFALAGPFGQNILCTVTGYDGINVEWEDRHVRSDDAVIGRVVYKPVGSCGPRVQRDYQFVMLHSGGCELRLDGEVHTLRVGHVRRAESGA